MKTKQTLIAAAIAVASLPGFQKANAQTAAWRLVGNANATATSKLGTTNAVPLNLTTNNQTRVSINSAGLVGIGNNAPTKAGLTVDAQAGGNNAIFGSNTTGVTIVSNFPNIGFNAFLVNGIWKNMQNGFASRLFFDPTAGGLDYSVSPTSQAAGSSTVLPTRFAIGPTGKTGINVSPVNIGGQFNDAMLQVKTDGDDNIRLLSNDDVNDWSIFSNSTTLGGLLLFKNAALRGTFDATTGAYSPISDARLKKDIVALPDVIEHVMKLQPKKYHFKTNDGAKDYSYGFIAQEVKEIFPEFITPVKDRKTGEETLTLNYNNFGVIAIKAIQEQQKQIDEQKKEIDDLKDMLKKVQIPSSGTVSQNTNAVTLTSASLEQNVPNPLTNSTGIAYTIPEGSKGVLFITDNNGKTLKQIVLNGSGKGVININASTLGTGAYSYTLAIDGKPVATKKMIVAK